MVSSLPPISHQELQESNQGRLLSIPSPFFGLALVFSLFRFVERARKHGFGLDDWFLLAGVVSRKALADSMNIIITYSS
jgi:hypothetical protein